MAAGTFVFFDHGIEHLARGDLDLASVTVVCAFVSAGYTPSRESHSVWTDLSTYECAQSGYAAEALTSVEISRIGSNAVRWDAADVVISASATMDIKYVVLYEQTNGYLIGYFDTNSGTTAGVDATQLTVQWNANGIAQLQG